MAEFILTYHGGIKPETPEERSEAMEKWKAWAATLDSALINPGTPVGITKVITPEGVSQNPSPHPIMGFSMIEAEDMDRALSLLSDCPHFEYGGTIEVSEMKEMPE